MNATWMHATSNPPDSITYGGKDKHEKFVRFGTISCAKIISSMRNLSLRKTAHIIGHLKTKNGDSNMGVIIFFVVSMGMASVPISLDYVLQLMWQKNNRTKKSS